MSTTDDHDKDGTEVDPQNALDMARDSCRDVNEKLADSDGKIAAMCITGTVGYHQYVATGETDPEYLYKIALLQALDESVFEMMHVDADEAGRAAQQVQTELERHFDAWTAEDVATRFQENLESLISVQEDEDAS